MRILVVDDEKLARARMRELIEASGEHSIVGEAANGNEAIERSMGLKPDCVLMDIRMPVMDGLEATKIIKKRWPWVKVIALTIYQNYRSEALSAGADAFLVKGCSVSELISTVYDLTQTSADANSKS